MRLTTVSSGLSFKRIAVLTPICLYFIAVFVINIVPFLGGQLDLLDFGSFYAAGLKLRNGENPYDTNSEYVLDIDFPRVGAGGKMPNLNPPISAMAFGLIAGFDPHQAFKTWQIASALLFPCIILILTSVYKGNVTPTIFLWSFTLAGFWQTLILGQIYIFLLLFVVLGWILIQSGRHVLGGIAIGVVVAMKPNFVIWPLLLLVSGYSLPFLASAASSLLISLIPLLFYGIEIYRQWLDASALRMGTLILPGNSSIAGLTARFQDITTGIVISLILVCIFLFLLRRSAPVHKERLEYASGLGILLSILASPISWVGYTLFLLPVYFSLNKWTVLARISAAILTFPFIFVLKLWQSSFPFFVIFGWFYGWGLIVLLGDRASDFLTARGLSKSRSTADNLRPEEIHSAEDYIGDNS